MRKLMDKDKFDILQEAQDIVAQAEQSSPEEQFRKTIIEEYGEKWKDAEITNITLPDDQTTFLATVYCSTKNGEPIFHALIAVPVEDTARLIWPRKKRATKKKLLIIHYFILGAIIVWGLLWIFKLIPSTFYQIGIYPFMMLYALSTITIVIDWCKAFVANEREIKLIDEKIERLRK